MNFKTWTSIKFDELYDLHFRLMSWGSFWLKDFARISEVLWLEDLAWTQQAYRHQDLSRIWWALCHDDLDRNWWAKSILIWRLKLEFEELCCLKLLSFMTCILGSCSMSNMICNLGVHQGACQLTYTHQFWFRMKTCPHSQWQFYFLCKFWRWTTLDFQFKSYSVPYHEHA